MQCHVGGAINHGPQVDLSAGGDSARCNGDHPEILPTTLGEALALDGSMWANLWSLTLFLRCGEQGMDSAFLRKAEVVRKRSAKLNWHQLLGPFGSEFGVMAVYRCFLIIAFWKSLFLISYDFL